MIEYKSLMAIEDTKVLVFADRVWGIADTVSEALDKCKSVSGRRPRAYIVYVVHPDTKVDDMGALVYPAGYTPKRIYSIGVKKAT